MYDHHQLEIPPSFIALYVEPGRERPRASRAEIWARYDVCEDLASQLFEYARAQHFDLGIGEQDVLDRVLAGLQAPDAGIGPEEARWVIRRLAELEGWKDPGPG